MKQNKQVVYAVIENIPNGLQIAQYDSKKELEAAGYKTIRGGVKLGQMVFVKNDDVIVSNIVGLTTSVIIEKVDITNV